MKDWMIRTATGVAIFASFAAVLSAQQAKRIGCETCPATLRILTDMDCSVSVDGEKVGPIVRDAGMSVLVDLGEHLVVAEAGKFRWETNVIAERPGQVLIRTKLQAKASADAKSATQDEAIRTWAGHWRGEVSKKDYIDGGPRYTDRSVQLEFTVANGRCSAVWGWKDTYHGPGEGGPGTSTGDSHKVDCEILDSQRLRVSWAQGGEVTRTGDRAVVEFDHPDVGPLTMTLRR